VYRLAIAPVSLLTRPPLRADELLHVQRLLRLPPSTSILVARLRLHRRLGTTCPVQHVPCNHKVTGPASHSIRTPETPPTIERIKPLELHWPVDLPVVKEPVFVYVETQPQRLPAPGALFEILI